MTEEGKNKNSFPCASLTATWGGGGEEKLYDWGEARLLAILISIPDVGIWLLSRSG